MSLFSGIGSYLFGVPPISSAPYTQQAQQLQQGAGQYAGQEQTGYNQQQQLSDNLWNTINGTGPSVADVQLQQTLDQNLRNGMAMGAGGTGTNAALARYLAATQTGNNAAQAAQAGALLRAKEISDARAQLGQTAANMANEGGSMYGKNLDTGLGYANLGERAQEAQQKTNLAQEAAGLQFLSGIGSTYFGSGGGSGGGSPFGGGWSSGGGGGASPYSSIGDASSGAGSLSNGFTEEQAAAMGFA